MPTTDEQMITELHRINILLALYLTKGEPQLEQVRILTILGFKPKEIAEILATTSNTVSVTISRLNRRRKNRQTDLERDEE